MPEFLPDPAGFLPALWARSLLTGEKCALCGGNTTRGRDVICPGCKEQLRREASFVCLKCGALVSDCLCLPTRMREGGITEFVKLFPYMPGEKTVSGKIMYRLKKTEDRMLARRVAGELALRLRPLLRDCGTDRVTVTYIPRSRKRIRQNGTDQAKTLARAIADALGCRCEKLILRRGDGAVQKTLSAEERSRNTAGLFCTAGAIAPGQCVILTDDIVTTGVTAARCAALLRKAGAGRVIAAAAAHTVGREAEYFAPDAEAAQ